MGFQIGGGGGVGIEMSDRFDRKSSETEGSARADRAEGGARKQDMARQLREMQRVAAARPTREGATVVHQLPWGRSSASSAADLSVVTDFHDYHVDAGKHQLSDYELRKEGDDTEGDGGGNVGGRASGSSSGASGSMEVARRRPTATTPMRRARPYPACCTSEIRTVAGAPPPPVQEEAALEANLLHRESRPEGCRPAALRL